jgi:hypothetical protein
LRSGRPGIRAGSGAGRRVRRPGWSSDRFAGDRPPAVLAIRHRGRPAGSGQRGWSVVISIVGRELPA